MNDTLQLRVDSKTKKRAAGIFQSLGMDMSTGIKVYLERVIKEKGIPFRLLLTENGYTPEQEEKLSAMIRRGESDRKAGRLKTYVSVEEMHKDLLGS